MSSLVRRDITGDPLCSRWFVGCNARSTSIDSRTRFSDTVTHCPGNSSDAEPDCPGDAFPDDAGPAHSGTNTADSRTDTAKDTVPGDVREDSCTVSTDCPCSSTGDQDARTDGAFTGTDPTTHSAGEYLTDSTGSAQPEYPAVTIDQTDITAVADDAAHDEDAQPDDAHSRTDDAHTATDDADACADCTDDDRIADHPHQSHYGGAVGGSSRVCMSRKAPVRGPETANRESSEWILSLLHRLCVH